MKRILSRMRRAITDFNMIQNGDSVAVGVSGGKDSLTLLCALAGYRRFRGVDFTLKALTLDMGFEGCDLGGIRRLCEELEVEYITRETEIAKIVFDYRKETNPCSLCAKLRRGALHELAKESGCEKVALGHHLDDAVETYFLSLYYEGRINCFSPVTYLDRSGVTLIRPMIYVEESMVRGYAQRESLPVLYNPCPANGHTKREYIKNHIRHLSTEFPDVKEHVLGAIKRGLWQRKDAEERKG